MVQLLSLIAITLLFLLPLAHAAYFPAIRRHDSHYLHAPLSILDDDLAPTQYISLPLDHSDPTGHAPFLLRYWLNDTLYKPGAPLFFALGGEYEESPYDVSAVSGLSWYAEQFNALMVVAEHRFYGESVPAGDVSVANLRYLTTQQALADFTTLINNLTITLQLPANTPIIAFGGSYSGSLSAWLHLKYPTLVHGSLASSAPVHAQLDFPEYLNAVQHSLGPQCTSIFAQATRYIDTLLATPAQRVYLARAFNVCEGTIEGELNTWMFVNGLLGPVTSLVQYNDNDRTINITSACRYMAEVAAQSNALTALAAFNQWYNTAEDGSYPFASGDWCSSVSYDGYVQYLQADSADRQWTWQTCNEFGFYQTAEDVNVTRDGKVVLEPTAFSHRYLTTRGYLQLCSDLFNISADTVARNVQQTNDRYGGWHVSTNRTIFSNGLIDPWHTMSVLNETQLSPPPPSTLLALNLVNVIGPTSHCADLVLPWWTDSPQLVTARWRNVNQLSLWLTGSPLPSSSSSTASLPPPPPTDSSSSSSSSISTRSSTSSRSRIIDGSSSSIGGGGSSVVAGSSIPASSISGGGANSTSNSSSSSSTATDGGGGNDRRRSSMSSGAVVGIVVFAMLVGVVGIAAAVWWWRKRKATLASGGATGVGYHEDGLTTGYSSLLGSDARSSA